MSALNFIKRIFVAGAVILLSSFFYSCEDDTHVDVEENQHPFSGVWYAEGDNISDVFRTFPWDVDSMVLHFGPYDDHFGTFNGLREERAVIIEYSKNYTVKHKILYNPSQALDNGAYYTVDSIGYNDIYAFKIHPAFRVKYSDVNSTTPPANPDEYNAVEINGIFSIVNDKDSEKMQVEFVYDHWSMEAPKPEDGFGSTPLGDHNIHLFTKYVHNDESK